MDMKGCPPPKNLYGKRSAIVVVLHLETDKYIEKRWEKRVLEDHI